MVIITAMYKTVIRSIRDARRQRQYEDAVSDLMPTSKYWRDRTWLHRLFEV